MISQAFGLPWKYQVRSCQYDTGERNFRLLRAALAAKNALRDSEAKLIDLETGQELDSLGLPRK